MPLGLTKLEALNQVLESIDEPPFPSLPSAANPVDSTSIGARAEDVLDRVTRAKLGEGWPCNTEYAKAYTLDANGEVVLASDVLRVKGVAPPIQRDLSIRGGKIYNRNLNSADLGDQNDVIYADTIVDLDFEDISPDVKEIIAAEAAIVFQRRRQGNAQQDQFLQQERAVQDVRADRNPSMASGWNTAPLLASPPRDDN